MKFILQTAQNFDPKELELLKFRQENDELVVDSEEYVLVPKIVRNAKLYAMPEQTEVAYQKCYLIARRHEFIEPSIENAIPNLTGTEWTKNVK